MSHTLDMIERVDHGTPAGFADGCKSRGGCPNHHSRKLLTCYEAARAHGRYYPLTKLELTTEITRAMVRLARRSDSVGIRDLLEAQNQDVHRVEYSVTAWPGLGTEPPTRTTVPTGAGVEELS